MKRGSRSEPDRFLFRPVEFSRDRGLWLEGRLKLLLDQRAAMRALEIAALLEMLRSRRTVESEMPIASDSSWIEAAPRLRICSSMKARRCAGMSSGQRPGFCRLATMSLA